MKPYIFKQRNLIHIIDLRQTLRGLITGRKLTEAITARGEFVLFVGTKKQAREAVRHEASRCGMPYVAERWPGGLLTNYGTIRLRLERLEELEGLERSGEIQRHSKKMVSSLRREKRKILRNLGGVRKMTRLPGLLVVVDPAREHIAVAEARKLQIPIVALIDTDGNPDDVDVVVPGNDDSIGAIEIFLRAMSEAVLSGMARRGEVPSAPAATPEKAPGAEPAEGAEAEPQEAEPAGVVASEPAAEPISGAAEQEQEPAQDVAEEPSDEQSQQG